MTHFVGIDLAWGTRQPTGLAVLDAGARLLHIAAVRTDDEIVEHLAGYVAGECVVAIDAPLVVVNPTGRRPAEATLSADFARFHAGAHPSNTGKPEFAEGTRGARVAERLGVPIGIDAAVPRRAVEVYPHPATVVLFGLPTILKYKNKPGRTFSSLQAELQQLMSLVETIVQVEEPTGAEPAWSALREAVASATQKAQLRRVEDQVDAVVCAYVGLFAARRPESVTTYGDEESGFIVTPTLGARIDQRIDQRADDRADDRGGVVTRAVRTYAAEHAELVEAGHEAVALVTALLDEAGINYLSVTGRTKTVTSYAEKAARTAEGRPLYPDPAADITDALGIRVITYVASDVAAVADLLAEEVVVKDDRDLGRETASEGRFGYASRHLLIGLDPGRAADRAYAALRGRTAQVQVRTVLQHAWAEFEHDIRYKGEVPPEHAREFDRRFTLAAGLLELADQEFSTIRGRLRGMMPALPDGVAEEQPDPRIAPRELAAFLAGQYADAEWSRADHYGWISGLLLELGVTSLAELGDLLRRADEPAIAARMDYRFPPGAVRRLDDALLSEYGETYVGLHGNAHRRDALAARLARLTRAAPE